MVTRQINKWGEGGRLRDELMAAATRLLAQATSRDSVTLRGIARETGIAAPSIYKHFPDRDAVIDAVVADTFRELDEVCEQAYNAHGPGAPRVRAISRAYVGFATERPDQYRVLFERSTHNISATTGAFPAGLHAFGHLAEAMREAARSDSDHFQDAEALWAALHGLVTLRPATPRFPWTDPDALLDNLLDRFVAQD